MKKQKKKKCRHKNTDVNQCNACGHGEEYCFDCEKSRCSKTKNKWIKVF